MSTATTIAPAGSSISQMLERSVLFSVTFRTFGNTRKVSTDLVEVDADKKRIAVTKALLDSEEWRNVQKLDREVRGYLASRSLPSPFRDGLYLLPIVLIEEVEEKLRLYTLRREALVDQFMAAYEEQVERARTALRATFSERDYPAAPVVRERFVMTWQYLSLTAPTNLPPSLVEREREKIAGQWEAALEEARTLLRANLAGLVDWMVDRMSGADDGKPKVFKAGAIKNMQDFLDTFSARNLTDDVEVERLVEQARSLMGGVDAETLRKSADLRATVADGFSQIKTQLDTMLMGKPKRAIRFSDDDQ